MDTSSSNTSRRIFGSNKSIEAKLNEENESDSGLFMGRSIDVRKERTLGDRIWEKVYDWGGNKEGRKKLEKKYLLKHLVRLLGAEGISGEAEAKLQKLIKGSATYKEMARHGDKITPSDVMRVRLDAQVNRKFFVKATSEELEDLLALKLLRDNDQVMILKILTDLYEKNGNIEGVIECCERMVSFDGAKMVTRLAALKQLGKIYEKKGDLEKAAKCHQTIIGIEGIDSYYKYNALEKLVQIYHMLGEPEKVIECYQQMSRLEEIYYSVPAYEKLAEIYENQGDLTKAAEYYEQTITMRRGWVGTLEKSLERLIDIYNRLGGNVMVVERLEQVMSSKEIDSLRVKEMVWDKLSSIYEKEGGTVMVMEKIEQILSVNEIELPVKAMILNKLTTDDPVKAREVYTKLLASIIDRKYQDNSISSKHVLSILDRKSDVERSKIMENLFKHSELWIGENKRTLDEWTLVLNSADILGEFKYLSLLKYVIVASDLIKKFFINDPTMPEWNVLVQREEEIDGDEWEVLKTVANDIFDVVYKGEKEHKGNLAKFFDQCMGAEGAKTDAGKQAIRKRVAATVDYLNSLQAKYDQLTDDVEKEKLKKQIRGALDIITVGGQACPDRAIVFLTNLENYIKLLENPKRMANILVQMFKLECIKDYLTDPSQAENIETYLYFCLELNRPLGLGLSKGDAMLYEGVAIKIPLEEALKKLGPAFTKENLINFMAQDETLKARFEAEMEADEVVGEARSDYLDADGEYEDAKNEKLPKEKIDELQQLASAAAQKRAEAEENFYKVKAEELLREAGFLARIK